MSSRSQTAPLLHHLAFALGRQTDQALQEQLGIGMAQYRILRMVEDNPLVQQRDIAASFGQTEAGVSRQIKLLSNKELIRVRVNPKNRRQHLSALTAKGKRLTEAALDIFESIHNDALGSLPAKQKDQLSEVLISLHHHTCEPGKTAACDPLLQIWQKS